MPDERITLDTTPVLDAEPMSEEEGQRERDREHERALVAGITKRIEQQEERRKGHIQRYAEIKRLYRGQAEKTDVRGGRSEPGKTKANVASTEMFRNIESITSAEDAVAWGDQPNWEPYDHNLDDAETASLYHARHLIDQGHEQMGLRNILKDAIRSKNTFGRVTLEVLWKRTWRWVRSKETTKTPGEPVVDETGMPVVDPETGQPMMGPDQETTETVEREVIDEDRPDVKVIPPWRVFMDGECVKESSWVAIRRDLTREQVEEWVENAKALGMRTRDLTDLNPGGDAPGDTARTVSESMQRGAGIQPADDEVFRCVDYWGVNPEAKHPTKTGAKDRRMYRILVVNGVRAVIEGVTPLDHGRFPFLDTREIPEEETAEGLGAGQLLRAAQILINDNESLLQEMGKFALYGSWRRRGGSGTQVRAIRIFPGRVLDDEADGEMERHQMDTKPFTIVQNLLGVRMEGMRAASGATSNAQGLPSKADSATEFRSIAAESARRLAGMAGRFMDDIYRPLIEMEAALYEQFMPDDREVVSPVPMSGRVFHVRARKADLRLLQMRVRLRLATDLEFRKTMSRNMNQAMAQNIQLIGAVREMAQAIGPDALPMVTQTFSMLLPGIMALQRKNLAINGVPPDTVPPELTQHLQERLQQIEAVAAQRQAMEAQLMQAQAQGGVPQGGPDAGMVA